MFKKLFIALSLILILTACASNNKPLDDTDDTNTHIKDETPITQPLSENYIYDSSDIPDITLADLISIYGDDYKIDTYIANLEVIQFLRIYTFPDGSKFTSNYSSGDKELLQEFEDTLEDPINIGIDYSEDISPENIIITSGDIYTKELPLLNNMEIGTSFDEIISTYPDFDIEKSEIHNNYGNGNIITNTIDHTMGYPYRLNINNTYTSYQSMQYLYNIEENLLTDEYVNYSAQIRYHDNKPSAIIWNDYPQRNNFIAITYFDSNSNLFKYSFGDIVCLYFLSEF